MISGAAAWSRRREAGVGLEGRGMGRYSSFSSSSSLGLRQRNFAVRDPWLRGWNATFLERTDTIGTR